ncbi:DNA polymerase Y family protein [Sphingomonas panacisoli]|uniref:DNA-directed DNA polymerase n=1 Tax=Sphingomonas panacisoli TaxID=1813879 RepID=A0A5B8LIM5_9SPHN|nr:DNA polymerase Y family protein [Sphingomonas panacisoli]QDZ08127.1 DNA polymerase Y family protein [Sphingomonas panacisoli]
MRRVASVFLPQLPIERLGRDTAHKPPEPARPVAPPVDDDPGECSVPRSGHWRPGGRWAQDGRAAGAQPAHRQPAPRELGRRSEAAQHPFRALRGDDGTAVNALPAHHAAPAVAPFVLAIRQGQRDVIHAANADAQALGLAPGMPVTQAKALYAELEVAPADVAADRRALDRLAIHALRHWTPVATAAPPDGLLLDVTGTAHLFGGEATFARRLRRFLHRLGLTATIAIADTPGAAHALARFSARAITIAPEGKTIDAIAPLPLAALRLDDGALIAARRFGLERIADLLPMPRGPLARRLGRAAIERLDQAIGRVAEPIERIEPFEPPVAERRLLEPIGTPEAIGQVMHDLAHDLAAALRHQGLGAREMVLRLSRVDGTDQVLTLGLARANRDAVHLARLLHLRLEKVEPGMGIEIGRLIATRAEPLGAQALGNVLYDQGIDLATLVDQLAGRVGHRALFRAAPVESDVPERAVMAVPALDEPLAWPAWKRPARLLARPEPLSSVIALLPDQPPRRFAWRGETHDVVAGDGPERIHGEWWRRDGEVWAVRDYYRVEDRDGRRFWLFRRGDGVEPATGDLSWWMHGAFG